MNNLELLAAAILVAVFVYLLIKLGLRAYFNAMNGLARGSRTAITTSRSTKRATFARSRPRGS